MNSLRNSWSDAKEVNISSSLAVSFTVMSVMLSSESGNPGLVVRLLHYPADHGFSCKHESGDGRSILQSRASYLRGIDDPGLHQVFVLIGGGVETEVCILMSPDL